jgi:hypothetical protein
MNQACAKCGGRLEAEWAFCPHCATPIRHESEKMAPARPQKAPILSGFSGLLFGLLMAPAMMMGGILLCLMVGPWMVVGIPLVIGGICAPFVGVLLGVSAVRGKCPWCDAKISSVGLLNAFYCYACSQRIVMRKGDLLRAE